MTPMLGEKIIALIYSHDPSGIRRINLLKTLTTYDPKQVEDALKQFLEIGWIIKDTNARYHINYMNNDVLAFISKICKKYRLTPIDKIDIPTRWKKIQELLVDKKTFRKNKIREILTSLGIEIQKKIDEALALINETEYDRAIKTLKELKIIVSNEFSRVIKLAQGI